MMKTFLRYGSLVPVGLLAWLVTSSLLAQQPSKSTPAQTAIEDDDELVEVGEPYTEEVVEQQALRKQALRKQALRKPLPNTDAVVASFRFKAFEVKVAKRVAKVNAQVSLSSKRTDIRFIWRLSLLDEKGERLDTLLYDHQTFGMEAPGTIEPTFSEIIKLVPGAKMVQLSLYSCAPDTDPATFMNDEKANGFLALRRLKQL